MAITSSGIAPSASRSPRVSGARATRPAHADGREGHAAGRGARRRPPAGSPPERRGGPGRARRAARSSRTARSSRRRRTVVARPAARRSRRQGAARRRRRRWRPRRSRRASSGRGASRAAPPAKPAPGHVVELDRGGYLAYVSQTPTATTPQTAHATSASCRPGPPVGLVAWAARPPPRRDRMDRIIALTAAMLAGAVIATQAPTNAALGRLDRRPQSGRRELRGGRDRDRRHRAPRRGRSRRPARRPGRAGTTWAGSPARGSSRSPSSRSRRSASTLQTAAIIVGQLTMAAVVDHYGLLGVRCGR